MTISSREWLYLFIMRILSPIEQVQRRVGILPRKASVILGLGRISKSWYIKMTIIISNECPSTFRLRNADSKIWGVLLQSRQCSRVSNSVMSAFTRWGFSFRFSNIRLLTTFQLILMKLTRVSYPSLPDFPVLCGRNWWMCTQFTFPIPFCNSFFLLPDTRMPNALSYLGRESIPSVFPFLPPLPSFPHRSISPCLRNC